MKCILPPQTRHVLFATATLLLSGCADDPRQILDDMGRAYRTADRYSDDARVTVRQTHGDSSTEATSPYRVAFVRPDKIRIEAYDARVVADGAMLHAAVGTVPGQVLVDPVQSPLALDQLFSDDALRSTLAEGEGGCPTQLPLLLADDTLELILAASEAPPRIVGTETVDGHACSHLEITKPDGVLGLWIDRKSKLLRKMRVPTAAYAAGLSQEAGAPVGVSVEVEFTNASFEADVPAEAFSFDVPAGAAKVARLEPLERPEPLHPRIPDGPSLRARHQGLPGLWAAVSMAQEMEGRLGGGALLLGAVPPPPLQRDRSPWSGVSHGSR
jgi:outer membrane lipoprotein-sorting protein